MFYDVFYKLCLEKGVTPSKAALDCGLSKSVVSQWKNRNSNPQFEQLPKIAAYFGVSADYLLAQSLSAPAEGTAPASCLSEKQLSPEQKQLLLLSQKIPAEKVSLATRLLRSLLEENG